MRLRRPDFIPAMTGGRSKPGSLRKATDALLRAALLLAVVALVVTSMPAGATHSWGSYHWGRTSLDPFMLKLGDNVPSAWDKYLTTANSDWSGSSVLDTTIVTGSNLKPIRCKPTSGMVEVCAAKYGRNGWLGLAEIWVVGPHIVQGTAKMNDTYFSTATYDNDAWRQSVMCQEIGHTFGLDHQDENFDNENLGSCMDYASNPLGPPSNEHPDAHDYEQLETIYGSHSDDKTTIASTTSGDSAASGHRPEDWGRVVKRDAHGQPSVYERDFGGGRKVFTFVIWTAEGPPAGSGS